MIKNLLPLVMLVAIVGCTPPTQNIDTINDQGKPVMGLDYRDFDRAASEMVHRGKSNVHCPLPLCRRRSQSTAAL